MSLLFETIKVTGRMFQNIDGHNRRVAASRRALFGRTDVLDLGTEFLVPPDVGSGLYRCRVVYSEVIESVEFIPYEKRTIRTVRLVEADHIRYGHKFRDRSAIETLLREAGTDHILMVVNGEITDLSYANIAFRDGQQWITPSNPLLEGTKRQQLLDRHAIHGERITFTDLPRFTAAVPINAMLDIGDVPFLDVGTFLK